MKGRIAIFATLALSGCILVGAAEDGILRIRDGALKLGDEPVALVCAAELVLPNQGDDTDIDQADRLAARIADSGFTMSELPSGSAFFKGTPQSDPAEAVRQRFAASCGQRSMLLKAEALAPVLAAPPSRGDVGVLDEAETAEAWLGALEQSRELGFDPWVAAPWDPRLELALESRLRAWARAFNPYSGRPRAEDPAYGLFSFVSDWQKRMAGLVARDGSEGMPEFFASELRLEWNGWLFEKFGTDQSLADVAGYVPEGASISDGTMPFFPDEGVQGASWDKLRANFTSEIYIRHIRRLLEEFRIAGTVCGHVPGFTSWNGGATSVRALSGLRLQRDPSDNRRPLLFRADREAVIADPVGVAREAVAAGAQVFCIPAGSKDSREKFLSPESAGIAAQAFLAMRRGAEENAEPVLDESLFSFAEIAVPRDKPVRSVFPSGLAFRTVLVDEIPDSLALPAAEDAGVEVFLFLKRPERELQETEEGNDVKAEEAVTIRVAFSKVRDANVPRLTILADDAGLDKAIFVGGKFVSKRRPVAVDGESGAEIVGVANAEAGVTRFDFDSGVIAVDLRSGSPAKDFFRALGGE